MLVAHLFVTFLTLLPSTIPTAVRSNIIVIVADDLGWDDVGFHGSSEIPTPNLDALAADGIVLNNYYVQPLCTPSRSALMTGRYPIHTGMQHGTITGAAPYGLGLDQKLLPQYLKELNYSTHIVGKWHMGFFAEEYTPLWRGFDSFYGYYTGKADYWDHTDQEGEKVDTWGLDFRDDWKLVKDELGQYSTTLFTKRAEKIISSHNVNEPLFLYMAHQAVHSGNADKPLEAPEKYMQKVSHIKHKKRRTFAAMVSALDDSVGNITRALSQRGMLNNSMIVFTTDNGGPANGFDLNYASNWPLRGMKHTLWEGGTRGTAFIWTPNATLHYTSENLMHITDWLPTLLHAAGYDARKLPMDLDGIDQWRPLFIRHDKPLRTEILLNIDPKSATECGAIRIRDLKLIYGKKKKVPTATLR